MEFKIEVELERYIDNDGEFDGEKFFKGIEDEIRAEVVRQISNRRMNCYEMSPYDFKEIISRSYKDFLNSKSDEIVQFVTKKIMAKKELSDSAFDIPKNVMLNSDNKAYLDNLIDERIAKKFSTKGE